MKGIRGAFVLWVAVAVAATAVMVWPRSATQIVPEATPRVSVKASIEHVFVPDTLAADVKRPATRSLVEATPPPVPPTPVPTLTPPTRPPTPVAPPSGDRKGVREPTFERRTSGLLEQALDQQTPNFATSCGFSHSRTDDPIVFPGQEGASHLHDFFGNRTTDAHSTYTSLRGGQTSCHITEDTAAYWVPALYDDGEKVDPDITIAYYQSGNKDFATVEPYPEDLRVVVKEPDAVTWWCASKGSRTAAWSEPQKCYGNHHLVQRIDFPDCWDGQHLDVADHASHMVFADDWSCPASHPVPLPQLVLITHYPDSDGGDITLAPLDDPSDPHADFLNAWHQPTLERLVRDCINAGANCELDPPPEPA